MLFLFIETKKNEKKKKRSLPHDINTKIRFYRNTASKQNTDGKHLQGVTKLQTDTIIHRLK